jgi:hypothetical protein
VDIIRERIEQDVDPVLAPLWAGLQAERAVVVGNGPTAHVEFAPDYATRIAAARELLDRGYGRPMQATAVEHSGRIDAKHVVEIPDTAERRDAVLTVLARAGMPYSTSGNSN